MFGVECIGTSCVRAKHKFKNLYTTVLITAMNHVFVQSTMRYIYMQLWQHGNFNTSQLPNRSSYNDEIVHV